MRNAVGCLSSKHFTEQSWALVLLGHWCHMASHGQKVVSITPKTGTRNGCEEKGTRGGAEVKKVVHTTLSCTIDQCALQNIFYTWLLTICSGGTHLPV